MWLKVMLGRLASVLFSDVAGSFSLCLSLALFLSLFFSQFFFIMGGLSTGAGTVARSGTFSNPGLKNWRANAN